MAYQALYRKYRLKTFDDMVGQEHISNTIKNAIKLNKISHAYLFSGPRGTGKTSIAKLIARAVNCSGEEVLCGKCDSCVEILTTDSTDIIEIDAASNNGVDEIREIRDKVKYLPASLKYKVYIIDETHMLTNQAFNALLKTLEEPPRHVIFILATTEAHKIPLTILSRCQRFEFRKISVDNIITRLNQVINAENIKITDDAIKLISYLCDGGMRDALGLLDQVSSYLEREITVDDIYNVTGVASKDAVELVLNAILSANKIEVLRTINNLNNEGKDLIKLCEFIINYLRDVLVYNNGIKDDVLYYDSKTFKNISELGSKKIYDIIIYLTQAQYKLKTVYNPKIYLEVTLINLMNIYLGEEINELETENKLSFEGSVEVEIIEDKLSFEESGEVEIIEDSVIDIEAEVVSVKEDEITLDMRRKYLNYLRGIRINNVLSRATKEILVDIRDKWVNIQFVEVDINNTHLLSILTSSNPRAAYKEGLIISVESEMVVNKLMEEIIIVEAVLKEAIGYPIKLGVLSESEWSKIKQNYVNKLKVGESYKFLEEQTINEYFNVVDKTEEIINTVKTYFGEENVVVEE